MFRLLFFLNPFQIKLVNKYFKSPILRHSLLHPGCTLWGVKCRRASHMIMRKYLKKILCIFVQLRIKMYCIADVTMVTVYACVTYWHLYDAGCQIASSYL